ncbi:MAG TPA: RNA-binding protein [Candidatus Sumerlaeota bacterium]|nr:MAG: RNA recognition motif [candidate division BRC1 bacterium ADurb.BinA292]HOE95749.1 RNA-binding protein [Candidatus Sumerlaeota bacterium]HOR27379.1 RNA-binding protein [Candidatus Sumerlaeota bacterium]HPK01585.1 RNA-binding protein [Candidatus Sumerlaeota bacterium]
MNIYVGNLSYQTTEPELRELFEQFGEVASVSIIRDKMTDRSKGFGFVEMNNEEEGNAAIAALNEKEVKGRALRINEARPREDRPARGPRTSGSGFGGPRREGGFGGPRREGGFGGGRRDGGNGPRGW